MKMDRKQMLTEYQMLRSILQSTYDKALALDELFIAGQLATFLTTCEAKISTYRKEEREAQLEELKAKKSP